MARKKTEALDGAQEDRRRALIAFLDDLERMAEGTPQGQSGACEFIPPVRLPDEIFVENLDDGALQAGGSRWQFHFSAGRAMRAVRDEHRDMWIECETV